MQLYRWAFHQAISAVVIDGIEIIPPYREAARPGTKEARSGPHPELPEEGMPFFLDENGCPEHDLNCFLDFLRDDGMELSSVEDYATDVLVFSRFLATSRGKTLWEATSEDTRAYRQERLHGPLNVRLEKSSYLRAAASLKRLYTWAESPEVQKITAAPRTKWRGDRAERQNTVRMISLADYLVFRKVGMLGMKPDQTVDPSFHGRFPLRNSAFAEYLITTGLRVSEASSTLVGELPDPDSHVYDSDNGVATDARGIQGGKLRIALIGIPGAISKNKVGRRVPFPRRVGLEYIGPYVREERAILVERWRRSGGAERRRNTMILACPSGPGRIRVHGAQKTISISKLSVEERRRLVLLPHLDAPLAEAQPGALWLGEDGEPMHPDGWRSVFSRASERCAKFDFDLYVHPHVLRHSFAVHWLSHLIKGQVGHLERLARLKRAMDSSDEMARERYLKIVGDPLRTIQLWLGHASQLTTQRYLTYIHEAKEILELAMEHFDEVLGATAPERT